jgi:glycosyltransferase involved in cell wall biosynthesis
VAAPERIVVVDSGIDIGACEASVSLRNSTRNDLGVSESDLLISSAGRLSAQKAPANFVRAAAIISQSKPEARFLWIGDGELRGIVEAEAARLGIADQFRVLGYVPDIRPFLNATDIFCLLSEYESFGYVTVEAMAHGLPAVGTRVAGTMDVIEDCVTGFLVEPNDPSTAANRIMSLMDSKELRTSLGGAAVESARRRFDVRRMAAETASVYGHLVERHG